jgi:hypothetical protein
MNAFENVVVGLLQGVEIDAPLFVKSAQGNLILNASETLLASVLARFAPPTPAPAQAPPVSSN